MPYVTRSIEICTVTRCRSRPRCCPNVADGDMHIMLHITTMLQGLHCRRLHACHAAHYDDAAGVTLQTRDVPSIRRVLF